MIVEVKISRPWQVWIDGVKPETEWSIDDEAKEVEETYRYHTDGLKIGGRDVEWVSFDSPQDDWMVEPDGVKLGPTEGYIKFADSANAIYLNVKGFFYMTDREYCGMTLGVRLTNGEWVEVDETIVVVRMQTVE